MRNSTFLTLALFIVSFSISTIKAQIITDFYLTNSITEKKLHPISNGDRISTNDFSGQKLNIKVRTSKKKLMRIEYIINSPDGFNQISLKPDQPVFDRNTSIQEGHYHLTAIPIYLNANNEEVAGEAGFIHFEIVKENPFSNFETLKMNQKGRSVLASDLNHLNKNIPISSKPSPADSIIVPSIESVIQDIKNNKSATNARVLSTSQEYCLNGGVITQQSEIDSFNCTQVNSSLVIIGAEITNLEGLGSLQSVNGSLYIYNSSIESLKGLDGLVSINGNLSIDNNDRLLKIDNLSHLSFLKNLFINNNGLLKSVSGLNALEEIDGGFQIYNNFSLADISGFSSLKVITGRFSIFYNRSISHLNGLSSLTAIGKSLMVHDNIQLSDLTGISGIISIGRNLEIYNNPTLSSCSDMCSLISPKCLEGEAYIENNGASSCTTQHLIDNCGEEYCLRGIILTTQDQVDAFDCPKVNGNVLINGDDITNLSGLSELESVNSMYIYKNPNLLSLDGLQSLTDISNDLYILENDILKDMTGLSGIDSLESLLVGSNMQQINFQGMSGLTYIDDFQIEAYEQPISLEGLSGLKSVNDFSIARNNGLSDLRGLTNLSYIGHLDIYENASFTNLDGLENITHVGDLIIKNNPNLTNIDGLSNLKIVDGAFDISFNGLITDYSPLSKLETVGSLVIEGWESLTTLEIFENLQHVGSLRISGTQNLINLKGLERITTLENLFIGLNWKLENLVGLENLITINQELHIVFTSLNNLNGLNNLQSVGDLYISWFWDASDINALSSLKTVYRSFKIESEDLNSIEGLKNLSYVGGDLSIDVNTNNFCPLYPLFSSGTVMGDVYLNGNEGEKTPEDILTYCISEYCSGNIQLDTQEKVNAFGCSSFTGNLTVIGSDITNLQGLSQLDSVKGSFKIFNTSLVNMEDLSHLSYVGGNLGIDNNDLLVSLSGLDSLTTLKEGLFINNNDLLTDLTGLTGITSIYGDIRFLNNDLLSDLNGLHNLTYTKKRFLIDGNDNLKSLYGLQNLTTIEESLWIVDNKELIDISDLLRINYIGHALIAGNSKLSDCCVIYDLINSAEIGFNFSVSGNGAGCSLDEIMVNCVPLPCSGNIWLNTQAMVDRFNCSSFEGNLTISGEDIHDLSNLSSLDSVIGNLEIAYNYSLENLDGLSNLSYIGGTLDFYNNIVLTEINGLSELETIEGDLEITFNPALKSISGLENLKSINGNALSLSSYEPSSIYTEQGDIILLFNPLLEEISGFTSLLNLEGNLHIEENTRLNSLTGFSNLERINGSITLKNNSILNIDGFSKLKTISGDLLFLDGLSDINCFNGLERIGGNLNIDYNPNLTGIDGFNNLREVEGDVSIYSNQHLMTLLGLTDLEKVSGDLKVTTNARLIQCCGLYNILANGEVLGDVNIENYGTGGCNAENIVSNCAEPQPPCTGDYVINSSEKMNSFECQTFDGSLTVMGIGWNAEDLSGLSELDSLTGDLSIFYTQIEDFTGLDSLTYLGGSLGLTFNFQLNSLKGLSGLTKVDGSIVMSYNSPVSDCCPVYPLLSSGGLAGTFSVEGCDEADILANCGDDFLRYSNEEMYYNTYNLTDNEEFLVFPNPLTENNLNIQWKSDALSTGTIRVLNLNGKEIYRHQTNLKKGINQITPDLSNIDNGAYILSLENGGKVEYIKLIKSK